MPVYEYKCKDHGMFYELAGMDESQAPKDCPECGKSCARIILVAPEILDMSPDKRKAHETNEKAQHEPSYSTKDRRENDQQHSSSCGCNKEKPGGSKLLLTANGEKMFPSMRPWMISH